MARGSEQATWKWAGDLRHCDTCGEKLRIADVGLFYEDAKGRGIRCMDCVNAKVAAFVAYTRRELGLDAAA